MCGGGCNTSQSTTAANPDAQAAYTDVVGKAQSVANTPYQPYTGQLVAPLNAGQNLAATRLQGAYGAAQPYFDLGGSYLASAGAGLGNVGQFLQAGSQATAGVAGYQQQAANAFGQANTFLGQSAASLGDVGKYLGKADGYFGQAADLATPQDFNGLAGVQSFMNPFTSSVIDTTMARARQENAAQTASLVGNAIGNGAYGGDRNGIAVATLAGQQALANDQTIAGLNQANYAQATQQFNTTQDQRARAAGIFQGLGQGELSAGQLQGQTAQQYGTLAGLSTSVGNGYNSTGQLGLGAAGMYGTLGQLQGTTGQAFGSLAGQAGSLGAANQSALISGASAGLQAATLRQQNQQQQDTAAYNQYMAGLSYPYQNVGFLSNIVQGIGSQEGNTQTTQGNALSQIAGLGTSAIGILGATGGFGANGYLSSIGSTFTGSDERIKEDVAPIGKSFDGQTLYRYRYKGDPEVRTGLIAQEVAKRDPGAVADIGGGVLGVDYDRATAGSARLGLGSAPGHASRPQRAMGGALPSGYSLVGGALMPSPALQGLGTPSPVLARPMVMAGGAGLGARPRFDDGGGVDAGVPIPGGGLNTSPAALMAPGGLNTSPTALTGGAATAHAVQGLGARPTVQAAAPTSPQFAGAGLGSLAMNPSGGGAGLGSVGSTQDPGSSGFSPGAASGADSAGQGGGSGGLSQNAWLGVLAAGLGMMGGTSASGAANIGRGALEGLQFWNGLNQQDRNNSYRQSQLALEGRRADQEAAYQNTSLAQGSRQIDLKVQEMHAAADRAQKELAIRSGELANSTANTASEISTREQTAKIGRYSTTYVPDVGFVTRDLTNPTAQPTVSAFDPTGQDGGAPPPAAGGTPPAPTMPQPTASAPPPQGGVPASGGAPPIGGADRTMPGSAAPVPAPAGVAPAQGGVQGAGAPPPAGAGQGTTPAPTAATWQPTTAVPRGFRPPNQTGIYMNPGVLKGEQDNATETLKGTRGEAQAAGGLLMRLDEMDRQYAQLPKNGLLAPGQGATARADIAKGINTFAQATGATPPFDPNALAANENLLKDRFRLGADLAKSMGGREPGFIVEQAVRANPGADNTPLAYQRITAGLRAAAQYQQDRAAFFDDYNARFGHLNGAQQAFDKVNPPQAYADRAVISTVDQRDLGVLQKNADNPAARAKFDQLYGQGTASLALRPITVGR